MWKKLRYRIRDYFGFTQSETKGFIGLMLFIALCAVVPSMWKVWMSPRLDTYMSDKATLDSLMAALEIRQPPRKDKPGFEPPVVTEPKLFPFDPNQISAQQWQQLGLRSYLAERIVKYRSKGKKFRVKKDLLDVYGFPAEQFPRLEPYILLPDTLVREQVGKKYPEKNSITTPREDFRPRAFDLNTVDTLELEKIRGIGPALARRIYKYRDRLGGFVALEQLREVYGLDSVVIKEMLRYASLPEPAAVRKINVNTATVEELKRHPYISPRLATLIVAYRQQHGPFTNVQSLSNIKILDAATLRKVEPYLSY